ncbi:Enhancing lycopene biosynthesis protein 2 [Malonomonas rubra DSM 5091]|uniref:Enhancing lycopene biosynthesis protein 2 n=1 Tax=Malonomonas rubra DSM 5091 TaxID=1122189 RepID=A0A1M6F6H3_MALRU|nr:isoprenoid biosynthesis glyoxalase ElbB [Malonomonas rubra]SHI93307.1 Enhancing lycopene biosynthesis protein 2 [Malonomonas rubra DSM 5091]
MAKVGVVLAGCGVYDGSEIHEAVVTLLTLDRAGAEIVCMAPNIEQGVVNHLTGEQAEGSSRNVLEEAARIARGQISDIAQVKASDFDALIIPGGFGAAKNLCTFAFKGPDCEVNADVARLIREVIAAKKPLGALCIAPALVSKVLGEDKLPHRLTIGTDPATAEALTSMGSTHVDCSPRDCVVDEANKLVTTPAYMLAGSIGEAADGIEKAVKAVLELV